MKFQPNKKYTTIAIYAFIVIAASIVFSLLITQISVLFAIIGTFLGAITTIIYAAAIAYILNPLMKLFQNKVYPKVFKKEKSDNFLRNISVVTTYLAVLILLFFFLSIVIPQLWGSIYSFATQLPTYFTEVQNWLSGLLEDVVDRGIVTQSQIDSIMTSVNEFFNSITTMIYNAVPQIINTVSSFAMQIANIGIGFIISIYMILGKDKIKKQAKMINYAVLPKKVANEVLELTQMTDKIMGWFIRGKVLESAIVSAICFVGMVILNLPYPPLITFVMFVFNMIPYIGPLIGSIVCGFFILLVNPIQALWFIIFITVVQIIDGNLIGPKLIGDSTGLSALMVIFSIFVGGAFFGIIGMLLGVPVFAVLNILVKKFISQKLKKRGYFVDEDQLTFEDMGATIDEEPEPEQQIFEFSEDEEVIGQTDITGDEDDITDFKDI